jgi:hypothetical protein
MMPKREKSPAIKPWRLKKEIRRQEAGEWRNGKTENGEIMLAPDFSRVEKMHARKPQRFQPVFVGCR